MPFNPSQGEMNLDHAELISVIGDYGKAMESFGRSVKQRPNLDNSEQCPEHLRACELWCKVLDTLDKHFRKHWFNAV